MSKPFPGYEDIAKYFETDSTNVSYHNFLYNMRDVILYTEPFTDDWGGLDGTWYKRFTELAPKRPGGSWALLVVIIHVIERFRGFAEIFGAQEYSHPNMKLFFEDIIYERRKRAVQRNYVRTSIDVLDKARMHGAQELTSDMPEALEIRPIKRRSEDNKANKNVDSSISQRVKKVKTTEDSSASVLSTDDITQPNDKEKNEETREKFVRRYDFREQKEINYAEISSSDIDPHHLETIFEADFAEITLKIITETESEKNMEKTEESQFLFFIRHALLDFIAMFKNLSPKVLNRDMSERTYIVESISPIFRSFRNAFPEVKYEWIEKDVKSVKEAGSMFAINVKSRKTDLLFIRLSDATEIIHVEVSGPPFKADKKHTIVKSYSIQAIGDKLTLFSVSLVDKKKYLAIELASCVIPFSFEAIGCYTKIFNFFMIIRNELNEQKKLLKKIRTFVPSVDDTSELREWIDLPDDDLIPVTEDEMDELFLDDT
ncbi:8723_t:CDS:2 [Diversispora eburnea]|uniref:8723_t:CDS:1 n=1 Tax=Diversispora eburnea TaxID=1213867 RepID=A0A9N9GRL7_9GLOM|nr:8723_t:CDS:2 [Diversispora eburnea]